MDFRKYLPGSNDFKKGEIIEGHFKEGISLLLEVMDDTRAKPFSQITEEERNEWARLTHPDGMSQREMLDIMRDYYSDITLDTMAGIIRLRLARINNRPIADPLPENL